MHDAIRILREVVDALAHAHGHGILHRDIKPDNVMISGRHAVVMDFGVAKAVSDAGGEQLTTVGVAVGTPQYMSPEQATGEEDVDHRSDIYAIGTLGYEMLTGSPPFTGRTAQQVLSAQVLETPPDVREARPSVPQPLAELLARCLEKDPDRRWQSAEEILHRLEAMGTPSGGIGDPGSGRGRGDGPVVRFVGGSSRGCGNAAADGHADHRATTAHFPGTSRSGSFLVLPCLCIVDALPILGA